MNKDGFKPNLETHLIPLLSLKPEESPSSEKNGANSKNVHHPLLIQVDLLISSFCREKQIVFIMLHKYPDNFLTLNSYLRLPALAIQNGKKAIFETIEAVFSNQPIAIKFRFFQRSSVTMLMI